MRPKLRHFHGSITLDPIRFARDFEKVTLEVIQHLTKLGGARVTMTLEIEASAPEGAVLTIADFVVTGSRVAIYNDSATFHRGRRLRRDQAIRQRLRGGSAGWKIVELTARDLGRGGELVRQLNLAGK